MKKWIMSGLALLLASSAWAGKDDSMNLRFSPVGLLIGYLNVDFDFKLNDNWTLGPTVSYWSVSTSATGGFTQDIKLTATAFGARANWHKNGVFTDGLYVSPIVQIISASASSGSTTASVSTWGLQGLVGYHWFWDSFNLSLGGGFGMTGAAKAKVEEPGRSAEVNLSRSGGLALDFMLGFTF